MRVIAGIAKGTRLVAPKGSQVRPTSDAMRETIFAVLGDAVVGVRFLDLFAGSGSVGIEALSRGAEHCLFVERSRPCAEAIRRNLEACRLAGGADVTMADVWRATARLSRDGQYGMAFVDPPYDWPGLGRLVEALVVERRGLDGQATVIVQHRRDAELPKLVSPARVKKFGDTLISFFSSQGSAS